MSPIWLDPGTYDQMNCYVSGLGSAGATLRLGLYALDGTRLVDAGAALADTSGTKIITMTAPLTIDAGGWYFAAVVGEGAPATQPTIRRHGALDGALWGPIGHVNSLTGLPNSGYGIPGLVAALPPTVNMSTRVAVQSPIITVRKAT